MPTKHKSEIIILSKLGYNEQLSANELIRNNLCIKMCQTALSTNFKNNDKLWFSDMSVKKCSDTLKLHNDQNKLNLSQETK